MFIKNTFGILSNNINMVFKAMLYRLVVTVCGLLLMTAITYAGVSVIIRSSELNVVLLDLGRLLSQFFGIELTETVEIQSSFAALLSLVRANMGRIIGAVCGLVLVFLAMDFLLGLCNFTVGTMVDAYMSSLSKVDFTQTFIQSFKKAWKFELFYTVIKTLFFIVLFSVLLLIIVFVGKALNVLSVVFGLWIVICVSALFFTYTARLRPQIIAGASLGSALKNSHIPKEQFWPIFSSYIFSIVLIAYLNITMFFATFGAGIMVSIPLTYMYLVCLQNVIEYTISSKKYYIDYNHIIVPKELRNEDEQLLNKVDI